MLDKYLNEFKILSKKETEKCGLINLNVKIGDMRKIIKRDKLQGNYELGVACIQSAYYDLVIFGYILLNTDQVEAETLKAWAKLHSCPEILIDRLSIFVAENEKLAELLDYFKKENKAIYYAALDGHLMMVPTTHQEEVEEILKSAKDYMLNIENSELARKQLNSLISTIAVQKAEYSNEVFDLFDEYKDRSEVKNLRLRDIHKVYAGAKKANQLAKVRKSCRC